MKQVLLIIILINFQFLVAQDYDFGKVSKEELQEKFNPLDSSTNAMYLYKYRKTFFEYKQEQGFQLVTKIHQRLKIYNKDGFDYATKEINLYKNGGKKENVGNLKAYTYNLIGGEIEDVKLKKDGIFETELSRYRNQTKFTMPNIKEGSVIEYEYKVYSPFFSNVDEFKFQHDIPIKKLEAKFEAPEYFNFKVNTKGFLTVIPKKESKSDKIVFNNKSRTGGGLRSGVTTTYSTSNLNFIKHVSTYKLSNVPALREEPHVSNINNYRSAAIYELSYTKFPNEIVDYYSTTWKDVVKTIYKNEDFGNELNKSGYYEDDIDALISDISDPKLKANLIFNFVKTKVKWNKYYGYFTHDGVKKAYKEHSGNVAEINLMLTSMLRYAGLNANPVLVSTRSHGIPLFPTREGYNYVISGIEIPNSVILLDATSKYSSPNVLPFRALNWQGRIIRKQGSSSLIELYPNKKTQNTVALNVNLSNNGDIEGMTRSIKTTHKAMFYRESYIEANKEEFLENLENEYNGVEISDLEVKNQLDLSKPIMESYKFFSENQAEIIGNKIYFSPLFFLNSKENPFKLEKREFPVDFGYPSSNKYRINIKLPEGYKVETIPEPIAMKMPENMGSFKYNISSNESYVQLIINSEINSSIIAPQYYGALKEYFKQLIEKEAEKIVIIKI